MKVLPWAEFTSDLPEDHIEKGPYIVQFGGKSVAAAIGKMLERLGCVVSPPIYAHEHGWELDVQAGRRRMWGQVTLIEGYIFVFEDTSLIDKMLGRHNKVYLDTLMSLSEALAQDSRFHDVQWYSGADLLTGKPGAKAPVIR